MSINVFAFLGPETEDLDFRFTQAFLDFGLQVQLHPGQTLTKSCETGSLYLSVTRTPPQMPRLEAEAPLLIAFEYHVRKRGKQEARSMRWPPKGVGNYSHEARSRTAAGRSNAAAAMQILAMAILAKESGGYFYVEGNQAALPGELASKLADEELARFDHIYFDAYAHRFESWPLLDSASAFTWPPEILPPIAKVQTASTPSARFRYRFSWFHLPGILLLAYFLIATLLYS